MKICIISSYDNQGGAAVAANRLKDAFIHEGINVDYLVQKQKKLSNKKVIPIVNNLVQKASYYVRSKRDSVNFANGTKNFNFSKGFYGKDISTHPSVLSSDIVHLNWVHDGFLSIESIEKLIHLKGKIYWTLHDMWAFTGGCHYSGACRKFTSYCHACPVLGSDKERDLSFKVWHKKKEQLKEKIHFICPSNWMAEELRSSALFGDFPISIIPYSIDIDVFKPLDIEECKDKLGLDRNKKTILFGAVHALSDERKGAGKLIEALHLLNPEEYNLCIYGSTGEGDIAGIKTVFLGHINNVDQIVEAYNLADVFVSPSLEDNLPNTVIESLACGTPVVAFHTGGFPDMVVPDETGYLAKAFDVNDLATGIEKISFDKNRLTNNCRHKVISEYAPNIIVEKHMKLYQNSPNEKNKD